MDERERDPSRDARALSADALERLRRRAVLAVESGTPQVQVAHELGVSRRAVGQWVRAYREHGDAALRPGRRGRRPGERLTLDDWQQDRLLRTIAMGTPDDLGLPWLLWTRRAVAELIRRELGVTLSTVTVGRYLARWGILGPRPPDEPPPGPGQDTEVRAAVRVLFTWARVRLPPGQSGHALVAVTDQEIAHFLLGHRPFAAAELDTVERRLRMQLRSQVDIAVASYPRAHVDVVRDWLASRRTDGPSLPSMREGPDRGENPCPP